MFKFQIIASTILLAFTSCNSGINDANKEEAIGNETPGQPVESRPPDVGYKPAFQGQTRVAGVRTSTPYETKVITDNLTKPWGIAALPDGRFLISEKGGSFRIVSVNGQVSDKITGTQNVEEKGQGGLLGVSLDPDFSTNRTIYWAFTEKRKNGNGTSVGKGVLSADERSLENVQVIYRVMPTYEGNLHYGGRMVFSKDGNLFLATGDRFKKERRRHAQELNSGLGKIILINKDGKPVGGTTTSGAGGNAEIYSYGHRNVQGIAFHPETGDLWVAEFGPLGGDELNVVEQGKNYGWPIISYGLEYNSDTIGNGITQQEGLEQPVYYWDPVLSPSGMTFYKGSAIPEWKNNLFIAGLNSHHIARLVLENRKVIGEERILADQQQRFRHVIEGNDGALFAITDEGRLYRIGKK
ncbi:MAG: PQQ-dependent sugar dehydrogenase [Flavisolibacter sp.]|nr:PQQ-dependent sugar dehydrogenase [Flavisolibacter sp.]